MAENIDNSNIILGIDPGTNLMGYGLIDVSGKKPRLLAMGVIRLSKFENHYQRLQHIYRRVTGIVAEFKPAHVAIEAPFFGKNVQSMLKLGRAQGVAIAAALAFETDIFEYEPRKIKMAITGNGSASKEQVREMLRRILNIDKDALDQLELDATDALAAAMCHHYESSKPIKTSGPKTWKDFINSNPDKIIGKAPEP